MPDFTIEICAYTDDGDVYFDRHATSIEAAKNIIDEFEKRVKVSGQEKLEEQDDSITF